MSSSLNAVAAADLAALLNANTRFASMIAEAESLTGEERSNAAKQIVRLFAKRSREYVMLGGPLTDELNQHIPATDTVTESRALATTKTGETKKKEEATPPVKEPLKWLNAEIKVKAFKNSTEAEGTVNNYKKTAENLKLVAAALGLSLFEKKITQTEAEALINRLSKVSDVGVKALRDDMKKGQPALNPEWMAWDKERVRNASRGEKFEFLVGTEFQLRMVDKFPMFGFYDEDGKRGMKFFPICTAFFVLGKIRDESSGSWGLRISFPDLEFKYHDVTISAADLHADRGAFRAGLADQGFLIVPNGSNSKRPGVESLFAAIMPRVKNTLTIYSRPGWHDARFASVLGEVVGDDGSTVLSDRTGAQDREKKGALEDWRSAANELAGLNDHWAVGLASGFAGILIDRCGFDTAAACVSGPTSDGKTIALTLAASVHGNPRERASVLHPLRVTSNSIESLFERASGATIALDELALAEPRDVGAMLMLLASGTGKARMTKTSALQRTASWRCFVLFSSERSLRNIVEGAKGQYLGGHAVRCVDIATTGARRYEPARIRALGQKLKDNYGHAAPIFAQHLLNIGEDGEPAKLRERVAKAAMTLAGKDASPAQARAAHTFAVLAVAASLAEDAGLMLDSAAATDALERAWTRYAAGDELKAANPVAEALEKLADYVTTNRNHTILPLPKKGEELGVFGRGSVGPDDDKEERPQHRQAWGYYDDATVYIVKDRLVEMAGGVVKYDDLRRGLGDNLRRRGAKDMTWTELPGGMKLNHYRVAASFFVGADG